MYRYTMHVHCTWSRSWYVHYLQSFLQDFYITLRKQHQGMDSTPITTRQLESLIRLTESRARLELREVATKEDAEEVIEIMKYRSVGVQALYLQNTVMLSPLNHSSFKIVLWAMRRIRLVPVSGFCSAEQTKVIDALWIWYNAG